MIKLFVQIFIAIILAGILILLAVFYNDWKDVNNPVVQTSNIYETIQIIDNIDYELV